MLSTEFMLKPRPFLLLLLLLLGMQLTPFAAVAATQDDPAAESAPDPATQLKAAQKQLDSMKQLVSKATTDTQLSKLRLATDDLVASMDKLSADLQPVQEKLQAQLDVLGPAPAAGAL
ncbi:DUF3772 domain-containing protein, partial [Serratia marcescens]